MSLLLKAHLTGLVDFSKARPFDRFWYVKLRWIFRYLEDEGEKEHLQRIHDLHCGALDYTEQKTFDHHWEQAIEVESKLTKLTFPWRRGNDRKTIIADMTKQWEAVFGKMDDDETNKKIQQTVRGMYEHAARGQQQPGNSTLG